MPSLTTDFMSGKTAKPKTDEKVVLLKGQSQYDLLRVFIDDLAKGFEEIGYDTVVIDLLEKDFLQTMSKIQGTIKCFVSFNGMGTGIETYNQPMYDYLGIPLVSWFVDHPFYLRQAITYPMQRWIKIISNEKNYQFFRKEYRQPGTLSQCLQLGGCQRVEKLLPTEERPYDLVFFGSYSANIGVMDHLFNVKSKLLKTLVHETIEAAKFETERELYEIFYENLRALGIDPYEMDREKLMLIMADLDTYVRVFRRDYTLKALRDYPIMVFGNGWDDFEGKNSNFTFHKALNFPETVEMMAKSKVVFNIMPNNRTGIHDRLAYAMHQGAACLSEATPGLEQAFQHEKDIFFYHMKPELSDTLYNQVQKIFNDPMKISQVAQAGKSTVQEHFSWASRAAEIVKLVEIQDLMLVLKS